MENELKDMKRKILLLENELKEARKKKIQLAELYDEYYHEYFNTKRDDYALLTNIPKNVKHDKHILYDYSVLNVDTVGKIICEMINKKKNFNYKAERVIATEIGSASFYDRLYYPVLVIGAPKNLYEMEDNKKILLFTMINDL